MEINLNDTSQIISKTKDQFLFGGFTDPPPADVSTSLQTVKHHIPLTVLDSDAVKAVRRLNRFGFDAYLVGGCVRDILLKLEPKDFDVVTSARPTDVRRLFRNCRLIGRRFRLAHLLFRNRKIIEVATFRRTPTKQDKLTEQHAAENLFGSQADDAIRRDFTINAIMYDIENKEIVDWVHGLEDIEARILRTIGDPNRRLPEDPVRIIRAIKFGVRLDLKFDPPLWEAMKLHAPLVKTCATARLVEEVFKLLRSGSAARCLEFVHEIGVLEQLMPNLKKFTDSDQSTTNPWTFLQKADDMGKSGRPMSDSVLLAAMLYEPCKELLSGDEDISAKIEETLKHLVHPLTFTRRHLANVRQIMLIQRHLQTGPKTRRSKKFLDRDYAADAIDLYEIISGQSSCDNLVAQWRKELSRRHRAVDTTYKKRNHRRRRKQPAPPQ